MTHTYPELATLLLTHVGREEGYQFILHTAREQYPVPVDPNREDQSSHGDMMAAMEWALSQGWTFLGFQENNPVFRRDRAVQQMRFVQEGSQYVLQGPVWVGYPAAYCKDHGVLPGMTPKEVAAHMRKEHGWNLEPLFEGAVVTVQRFDSRPPPRFG